MTPIRVHVRGFSIELEPDDPRAKQIEALLLGPVEPPAPPPPPESPLSEAMLAFWDALDRFDRRLLLLLCDKPWPAEELEAALPSLRTPLRARNRRISMTAAALGLPIRVLSRGRTRDVRVYRLDERVAGWVRQMARTPAPA